MKVTMEGEDSDKGFCDLNEGDCFSFVGTDERLDTLRVKVSPTEYLMFEGNRQRPYVVNWGEKNPKWACNVIPCKIVSINWSHAL